MVGSVWFIEFITRDDNKNGQRNRDEWKMMIELDMSKSSNGLSTQPAVTQFYLLRCVRLLGKLSIAMSAQRPRYAHNVQKTLPPPPPLTTVIFVAVVSLHLHNVFCAITLIMIS